MYTSDPLQIIWLQTFPPNSHFFFVMFCFFIFKSSQSADCNESRAINSFPLTLVFLLVYNETWEVCPQCANHQKKAASLSGYSAQGIVDGK